MKTKYSYCIKIPSYKINMQFSNNYHLEKLGPEDGRDLYEIEMGKSYILYICFKTEEEFFYFKLKYGNIFE